MQFASGPKHNFDHYKNNSENSTKATQEFKPQVLALKTVSLNENRSLNAIFILL